MTLSLAKIVVSRTSLAVQVMNDLVVDRGPNPYLTNLLIKCNGRTMTTVQGDGMQFLADRTISQDVTVRCALVFL